MARDYIALDLEIPQDSFDVQIVPEVEGPLGALVQDATAALRLATEKATEAAAASRRAVSELKDDGMTQTEIAQVLHVSQQRVSQLLSEARGSAHHPERKTRAGGRARSTSVK